MIPQEEALEKRRKMLVDQHKLWLAQPVTNEAIKQLERYEREFKEALCNHILQKSDKEYEDTIRASIKTCMTIRQALTDTPTFVRLITTKES